MAKKATTPKPPKEPKPKSAAPYDYVRWLTSEKRKWEELSIEEQKGFSPYMVNRFLSMDLNYIEAINELQGFTLEMDKDKVWRVYYTLLPARASYNKYIKAESEVNIKEKDILLFMKYFNVKREYAIDYYETLARTEKGMMKIKSIRHSYTYDK